MDEILKRLFVLRDEEYKSFHSTLMPGIEPDRIIGIRIPHLRKLARELIKEGKSSAFISQLPHYYYEENNLHAFVISEIKDFDILINETERFLPFVDNWATCDSFRPKIFYKNKEKLLPYVYKWIESDGEYAVRFGIEVLMTCFLDDDFCEEYPRIVSEIRSDKYYVNTMIAWYFATAMTNHYDSIIVYLQKNKLSPWVHNKTISKACESNRITDEKKEYLRSLRIKYKD